MGRPRRSDDEQLLARIVVALEQRTDLTPWTLADVAPAAGIGPAALIRRFGSKSGLLRALTRRWIAQIPTEIPTSAVEAERELRAYVGREFGADSAAGAVFALSEVVGEFDDPELADLLADGWRRQAALLAGMLSALRLPRLGDADAAGLLLLDALHGSLFRSAVNLGPASSLHTLDRFLEIHR